MGTFSFGGTTIVAPGFILRSTIGTQRILQLLPFGKVLMVGPSDGGLGGGTIYEFTSTSTATDILRGGALLDALLLATNVGGVSSFAGVVAGVKAAAQATITGASSSTSTLTAGDQGVWTNGIMYEIQTGTSSGFAFTLQYTDAYGNVNTIGGLGSAYDNLADMNALAAVIAADALVTPPVSTGLQPIVTYTVQTNGVPTNSSGLVALAGGRGIGEIVNTTVAASPSPTTTAIGLTNAANVVVGANLWITVTSVLTQVTVLTVVGNVITFAAVGAAPTAGSAVTTLQFTDYQTAINEIVDESFDIGHLVGAYDLESQAYADAQAQETAPLGYLRRWIHQVNPTGTSPTNTKAANSEAVVNFGIGRATAIDSFRSSVIAQHANVLNPQTGAQQLADLAPIICGYAALTGATGVWGPATAFTYDTIPGVVSLDYTVLRTTGDADRAILGGLMVFENLIQGARCIQSVTTAPNDGTGVPWIYAEFSVVRVVDAVMANIKAAIETAQPKIMGGGNTIKTAGAIIATVKDILTQATSQQWITAWNPSAISVAPANNGQPTDDIVTWDMAPTFPLNHLGLSQTVQPFSITVQQLAGQSSSGTTTA